MNKFIFWQVGEWSKRNVVYMPRSRGSAIVLASNAFGTLEGKTANDVVIYEGKYKKGKIPRLMDGKTSDRIAEILLEKALK